MFEVKKTLTPLLIGPAILSSNAFAEDRYRDYELKKNETITDALWNRGFKPLYGKKGILIRILKENNLTIDDAKNLRPGQTLKMPVEIYEALNKEVPVSAPVAVVAPKESPVVVEEAPVVAPEISFDDSSETAIYNLKKNETITDALWNRGFKPLYGSKGILTKILKFNSVSFDQAKHLKPGYPLKVPVKLHTELMKPVPPKVEKPIVQKAPEPVVIPEPEVPSVPWTYSTQWAAGMVFFYHFYDEDISGDFVKTKKEQQLGLDFRNYTRIHQLHMDGNLFITKIQGANFPIEYNLYERFSLENISYAHISPFITGGYESFSYLGGKNLEVVSKKYSSLMYGAGLKWDFTLAHRKAFTSFEYLKSSDGSFLHLWLGVDLTEKIFSEFHFYKINFDKDGDVDGSRLNLNLGYRF